MCLKMHIHVHVCVIKERVNTCIEKSFNKCIFIFLENISMCMYTCLSISIYIYTWACKIVKK